jgi:serine/threonine protein kinase/alpha-tubulin suppressor-like RCC1 family protein
MHVHGDAEAIPVLADLEEEYELIGELGRGGMAVVHLARDRELQREVAIKVIRAHYIEDGEAMARFAREARTVARLSHPNIVSIHAVRRLSDGALALVMQYVAAHTLKQAIQRDGPFPAARAAAVLKDIATALQHAHAHGVVHRDVKPENILLEDGSDRALLFDFGIARSADAETHLTMTGIALGTPAYMPPEQIDGAELDGRSDLYSLGLVGWEMLTGQRPWNGEGLYSTIYKQKHEYLPSLAVLRPDVPSSLRLAIEGALHKDPAARWTSAHSFLVQLEAPASGRLPDRVSRREHRRVRAAVEAMHAAASASPATTEQETIYFRRPEAGTDALPPVPVAVPQPESRRLRPLHLALAGVALALLGGGVALAAALAARAAPAPNVPGAAASSAHAAVVAPVPAVDSVPGPALALSSPDSSAALDSATLAATTAVQDSAARASPAADSAAPAPAAAAVSAPAAGSTPADSAPAPPPVRVPARERVAIAAGGMHTCALDASGAAVCWGANDRGQLGSGSAEPDPGGVRAVGGIHFATLSAGVSQTCGVSRGGGIYCWGANENGQLGDGSRAGRTEPARVATSRSYAAVWTATTHTCALSSGGELSCWGANGVGQLGDGTRTDRATPRRVAGGLTFSTAAVGWQHSCGLTRDGALYCWGSNGDGQLGDGTRTDRSMPTAVARARFRTIVAGSAHTCALTDAGALYCWGRNGNGQLGDGTTGSRTRPTPVRSELRFSHVTAGSAHSCALTASGEALCWGRNAYGQLGDGTTADRAVPVRVAGEHRFTSLQASGAHTCGTTRAGGRLCWGYNLEGQLGDGTRTNRPLPTPVRTLGR